MPIKSYLVHPQEGKKTELVYTFSEIEECEVFPAENEDLIILVTDTESKHEEAVLKEKIDTINGIKLMALVSGFNTPKN